MSHVDAIHANRALLTGGRDVTAIPPDEAAYDAAVDVGIVITSLTGAPLVQTQRAAA